VLFPKIASGQTIISVAYREPTDVECNIRSTFVRRDQDGYVLNGRKSLVIAAPAADTLIVSASDPSVRAAHAVSLFLVDAARAGVSVRALPMVDGSICGEVYFENVRLPMQSLVGGEGEGDLALQAGLRYAILGVCAEMSGLAAGALDITAGYLKTRKQFGAPLASFQALRHKIAHMAIDCEMAKSAVLKLIASFQAPDQHNPTMTLALAKFILGEIGHRVCSQAIQLHGAVGLTKEYAIGRYFARATVIRSLYGSASYYLARYAKHLAAGLENGRV
jgi:alkylation response protein AidB-like acyl-CoA dehydrogenase